MADVEAAFRTPDPSCRPTPLYWWSGADLDRERLAVQLTELAAKGIGGTIVGYSHLPDGDLDHGSPAPLSSQWWELFRWFTEQSAELGLTVGIQDYGINGPILRAIGELTREHHPGTLVHVTERRTGPGTFTIPVSDRSLVTAAATDEAGSVQPVAVSAEGSYALPAGEWEVSLVLKRDGVIGSYPSSFDPLHPRSGALLIETLYQPFRDQLGTLFGTTFTTFFQDELDFGLRMPLWNDLVAERLREEHGFDHREWLPALWLDLGERTLRFRAAYRDTVVGLLEDHYFRPIFEWHERHGTSMFMDQVARGDVRGGRHAYGDYLQTMRWYNGPGNDDPDLTGPRSVAAFKVSASLARLNNRPIVANEAFHSSGWGIAPERILAGLNAGFAYGVNHVMMHGLSYSTEGGWWEWASPDFHFRQPWWEHSDTLWAYITRVSALLRYGRGVADIAVLDPTQDLDLSGDGVTSPEYAVKLLGTLAQAGHDCDLLDRLHLLEAEITGQQLTVGDCTYRAVIVPDVRAVRHDVAEKLGRFALAGGVVVVLGDPPTVTENGPCPPSVWDSALKLGAETRRSLPQVLAGMWEPDFDAHGSGLVATHRRSGTTDLYFVANVADAPVHASVDLRASGRIETFDAWTGSRFQCSSSPAPGKEHSTRVHLDLEPGLATVLVVDGTSQSLQSRTPPEVPGRVVELEGPWRVQTVPILDNSFGDFEFGAEPMGVQTWHVETSSSAAGPWTPTLVRDGEKFLALGPVLPEDGATVEDAIRNGRPRRGQVVLPGLAWRPYAFSYQTGVADDPLLLDRMTGPHGLKFVPDEFLDPTVLDGDAPAGSQYYFWSTVEVSDPAVTVSAGSRSRYRLWVDGEPVLEQADEVPATRTPAWKLRDLSVVPETLPLELSTGRHAVLLRVTVAEDQPTRASLAIGTKLADDCPRARLRWWYGEESCLTFDAADHEEQVWFRVATPPGFQSVSLATTGQVRSATLLSSHEPLRIEGRPDGRSFLSLRDAPSLDSRDVLLLMVESTKHGYRDAAVLTEPIDWQLTEGTAPTADFVAHGLGDFSGVVRYRSDFAWQSTGERVLLSLPGVESSARITLNGREVGTLLTDRQEVELTETVAVGTNTLEIQVANTLVNRFSVLPSPFSRMQRPGGGFRAVRLRTHG
ncbi:glycosyl hydrolase [Kribbella italica]|uniref:Alpha-L-rhamnosidase-like protein n=1 Tax=Kribbella italica TaxID=1540520 RepID=A0A7W9J550_9ACTN|nr:glycosyl hydrolase [Kribbella italica]MBB5835789.1 hypothetical protein [Kribbella italica]